MIITSPFSVPLGWCFRWCKVWGKRKQGWRADGVLDLEELGEFVRLHQRGVGLGGVLDDGVGGVVRGLIEGECRTVGQGNDWSLVPKADEGEEVDARLLALVCRAHCPFLIVGKGVKGNEGVAGAVLREVRASQDHGSRQSGLVFADNSRKYVRLVCVKDQSISKICRFIQFRS